MRPPGTSFSPQAGGRSGAGRAPPSHPQRRAEGQEPGREPEFPLLAMAATCPPLGSQEGRVREEPTVQPPPWHSAPAVLGSPQAPSGRASLPWRQEQFPPKTVTGEKVAPKREGSALCQSLCCSPGAVTYRSGSQGLPCDSVLCSRHGPTLALTSSSQSLGPGRLLWFSSGPEPGGVRADGGWVDEARWGQPWDGATVPLPVWAAVNLQDTIPVLQRPSAHLPWLLLGLLPP